MSNETIGNPSDTQVQGGGTEAPSTTTTQPGQANDAGSTQANSSVTTQNDKAYTPEQIAALMGKVGGLETERNSLSSKVSDYDKRVPELEKTIKGYEVFEEALKEDRAAYELTRAAILRTKGVDIGSHEERFKASTPQNQASTNTKQNLDIDTVKKIASDQYRSDKYYDSHMTKFFAKVTELDPSNIKTPEEAQKAEARVSKDEKIAKIIIEDNPNMPFWEAMVKADQFNNLDNLLNTAQKTGVMIGKSDKLNSNAGVQGNIAGGSSQASSEGIDLAQLNDKDRETYTRLLKYNGKSIASKFYNKSVE